MLTADRDSRRRGEEGTGEVESLHGRMKGQKMGDRLDKGNKPEVRRVMRWFSLPLSTLDLMAWMMVLMVVVFV